MSLCKRAASKRGWKWEMPPGSPRGPCSAPQVGMELTCYVWFQSVQHFGVCLSQPPMVVPLPFRVDSLLSHSPWLSVRVARAGRPPSSPACLRPSWKSLHFLCILLFGHAQGVCGSVVFIPQFVHYFLSCTTVNGQYCLVFCQKKLADNTRLHEQAPIWVIEEERSLRWMREKKRKFWLPTRSNKVTSFPPQKGNVILGCIKMRTKEGLTLVNPWQIPWRFWRVSRIFSGARGESQQGEEPRLRKYKKFGDIYGVVFKYLIDIHMKRNLDLSLKSLEFKNAKSLQLCPTLYNPMDCSPPGSSVHGILQARILEWVAISFFKESFQPRDRTHVSYVSCIGRWVLYH